MNFKKTKSKGLWNMGPAGKKQSRETEPDDLLNTWRTTLGNNNEMYILGNG